MSTCVYGKWFFITFISNPLPPLHASSSYCHHSNQPLLTLSISFTVNSLYLSPSLGSSSYYFLRLHSVQGPETKSASDLSFCRHMTIYITHYRPSVGLDTNMYTYTRKTAVVSTGVFLWRSYFFLSNLM